MSFHIRPACGKNVYYERKSLTENKSTCSLLIIRSDVVVCWLHSVSAGAGCRTRQDESPSD